MDLGLMVEPQVGGSYQRLLELARWSEAQNLTAFAAPTTISTEASRRMQPML